MNERVYFFIVLTLYINFKERLPIMLEECLEYLNGRHQNNSDFTYEVVKRDLLSFYIVRVAKNL